MKSHVIVYVIDHKPYLSDSRLFFECWIFLNDRLIYIDESVDLDILILSHNLQELSPI